ncbi:hypothetical protein [Limnospira sp. PMC 289.06]|uniref:hypothetical protein n=2 Tax=Oscillatoriales TaxID=1150 RepID=UPI0028E16B8A|nr:hypothetical protein [Limnospira sp. PMC 289.06]
MQVTRIDTTVKIDGSIDLSKEELEERWASGDYPEPIEIGRMQAHRFDLYYNQGEVVIVADCMNSDLSYFASFFLLEEGQDAIEYSRYLFYINSVFIEPKYRGMDYGLQALAMFLQGFAWGEVVGCHPVPTNDLSGKYPKQKGQSLLRKYWSKVGFESYSEKHNILWTSEWEMPRWLKRKIFEEEKWY